MVRDDPGPTTPPQVKMPGASQGTGDSPLGGNMEDRALMHPYPQGELEG